MGRKTSGLGPPSMPVSTQHLALSQALRVCSPGGRKNSNDCLLLMLRKRGIEHFQCKLSVGRGLGKEQCTRCSDLLQLENLGKAGRVVSAAFQHGLKMDRTHMCVKRGRGFGISP